MRIKTLNLQNFGKFEDYELNLDDGFNIIYGKNEYGKSTIMDFIIMMFYGYSGRKSKICENPRKKYLPWNKNKMKGKITFVHDKTEYVLERSFDKSNRTDEVKIYNNLTGEEKRITGDPGKYFFNLNRESFERTVFISSNSVNIISDSKEDEITQKLLNLVTTGDEKTSYDKTLNHLNNEIYSIKSKNGKKGSLIEIENRIDELNRLMSQAIEDEEIKEKYKNKLKRNSSDLEKLEKEQLFIKEEISNLNNLKEYIEIDEVVNSSEKIKCINQDIELLKDSLKTPDGIIDNKYITECRNSLTNLTNLNSQIENKDNQIKKQKEYIRNKEKEFESLKEINSDVIENLKEYEKKVSELEKLIRDKNRILEVQKTYQNIISELKTLNHKKEKIENCISEKQVILDEKSKKYNELNNEINYKENNLEKIRNNYYNKQNELLEFTKDLNNIEKENNDLEKDIKNIEKEIELNQINTKSDKFSAEMKKVLNLFITLTTIILAISLITKNSSIKLLAILITIVTFILFIISKINSENYINKDIEKEKITKELEDKLVVYKEKHKKFNNSEKVKKKVELTSQIEERQNFIKNYNDKRKRIDTYLESKKLNLNEALKEKHKISEELSNLKVKSKLNEEQIDKNKETLNECNVLSNIEYDKFITEVHSLKNNKNTIEDKILGVLLDYECDDILDLSNYHNEYNTKKDKLIDYQQQLEKLNKEFIDFNNQYNKNKSLITDQLSYFGQIEDINYASDIIVDLEKNLEKFKSLKVQLETKNEVYQNKIKNTSIEELIERRNFLKQQISDYNIEDIDSTEVDKEIEDDELLLKNNVADVQKIKTEITKLETEVKTKFIDKDNVSQIDEKLNKEINKKIKLENKYKALNEAISCLDYSLRELQKDFSPAINKITSENFSFITNGKYENVKVDKNYNIYVEDKETGDLKEWDYLSSGTIDQAYISLRLAVAEVLGNKENPLPLFLDDIFIQFDEERTKQSINLIKSITNNSEDKPQIILFTCHKWILNLSDNIKDLNAIIL